MTYTETEPNSEIVPLATNLVSSGENLFKSLTGHDMNNNQQKISDGLTKIVDGVLPTLEKMVSFDLKDLLEGLTETLNGLTKTINSTKSINNPKINT